MKVDINNRKELNKLLEALAETTAGSWGVMKAQNMIEHLAMIIEYSNGKRTIEQITTNEEANAIKQKMIYSDMEIPQGLKSPLLPEEAAPFRFSNVDEAKKNLIEQLDDFEMFFKNNPDAKPIQPRMGPLKHNEWIILHNKHLAHHFKQFGLIE